MGTTAPERRAVLGTLGAVALIVLAVVAANLGGGPLGASAPDPAAVGSPAGPSSSAATTAVGPTRAAELATLAPEVVAESALGDRGEVAGSAGPTAAPTNPSGPAADPSLPPEEVPSAGRSLAGAAESLAARRPFSFTVTTLNILGTQHTAPGGTTRGFAPGPTRAGWAAALLASYGSSVVGLQELQADQLAALSTGLGGRFEAWPGSALGRGGLAQSLIWDTGVWQATYRGSVSVPFMGGTRPQPVVRLQHLETGREVYVLNVHNSPRDRRGREEERDAATRIEVAAVRELRADGIPVVVLGDFNEREEIFCTMTGAGLVAAQGATSGGGCRPPAQRRVDWIFASPDVRLSGLRLDTGPAVRRITDHAVLTTSVSVP